MKNLNIFSSVTEYENAKSGGVLNKPNVSFVNEDSSVRYFTDIKYEYVDLGLSVKWATCNVGASSPEEYGLYFAWGETIGYTGEQVTSGVRVFDWDSYNSGPAASISTDLTLEHDAAHVNMGGNWRMPTRAEYQELINKCNVVWTSDYNGTGVKGRVFTSKVNGKSVFFPVSGWCEHSSAKYVGSEGNYWSASYYSTGDAWYLYIRFGDQFLYNLNFKCYGLSVRGVCE